MSSLSLTKYCDCAAKVAVYGVFNLISWISRGFRLLLAPLYPLLKWVACGVLGSLALSLATAWILAGSPPRELTSVVEFIEAHITLILLSTEGYLILFLAASVGHREKDNRRRLREAFPICKAAEELEFDDLGFRETDPQEPVAQESFLYTRPFFKTYFSRNVIDWPEYSRDDDAEMAPLLGEDVLQQLLQQGQGFLLLGPPISGKTLTLFQVLHRMTGYTVVSPDGSRPVPDEETFELLKGRRVVILLDDLATLPLDYDLAVFSKRITKATGSPCGVAGTCRWGGTSHDNHVTQFCEGLRKFRMRLMTIEERIKLGATAGIILDLKEAWTCPLPGNITMRKWIREMIERFDKLPESSKDALRAMKLLYSGGVRVTFSRLQTLLLDVFHRDPKQHEPMEILKTLWNEHFLLKQPSANMLEDCLHFGLLAEAVSYEEGREPKDERWHALTKALQEAGDMEALLHLGYKQGHFGELKRALQTMDAVLGLNPNSAEGHYSRGYTLARLGRPGEALEANKRALELRPEFTEALNNRGYILSCLGKLTDAEAVLRHVLELSPNHEDAHTNLGIVLARTGRLQEAIQEIRTALGLRQENYYAYLNLAINLSRENDFDEALKAYDKALEFRPDYPEVYFNRGITLAKLDRFEEALAAHDKAITLRDNYAEAHMHRGMTLFHLRRNMEAIEAHSRAIELQDDYALAYMNRGLTYAHMGNEYVEQAKKDGQAALALGSVPLHSILSIAKSLGINGALPDALAMIDDIIAAAPEFPDAHLERGITLSHLGCNMEAIEAHSRAIELQDDYALAFTNRALVFVNLKRLEDARADFDRALDLDPANAKLHLNRAITLARLGGFEKALADYNQAINLDQNYSEAYFQKAKTLCFFALVPPCNRESLLGDAMKLLEDAVAIDNNIIGQINHETGAFRVLRNHPVYGHRLTALVGQ